MTDLTNVNTVHELRQAAVACSTEGDDATGLYFNLAMNLAMIEGMLVERGPKEKPGKEFGVCGGCGQAIYQLNAGGWVHVQEDRAFCCGRAEPASQHTSSNSLSP